MEEFNRNEFNKLCAEFLEIENSKTNYPEVDTARPESTYFCTYLNAAYHYEKEYAPKVVPFDFLIFDTDWNWIMKLIEKIEATYDEFHGYFGVHISSNNCTIQGSKLRLDPENPHYAYFNDVTLNTKKEATVYCIWSFLNWYNKNIK